MDRGILAVILSTLLLMPSIHAGAEDTIVSHGLSAFGDLKYAEDFPHFDYVNPDAPKGGKLSHTVITAANTFDNLNVWILKGDGAKGLSLNPPDSATSLVFDTLMVPSGDEPSSGYGLVAREIEVPPDRSWVIYRLRPEARFHDGSFLTAEDVKFSLDILKEEGNPRLVVSLQDVENVEVLGPHEVKVTFVEGVATRLLPLEIASFPILSKAYYATVDFTKTTLEPPLGSGPYKVGKFKQGTFIEFDRVPDYWAKDLPVNVGRWNFDTLRWEYFRERNVAFQAFASREYNLREEFTSKTWMTEYNFPAVTDGRVLKLEIPDARPSGVYGFYINLRREKFRDIRVRKALDLAFDFEWMNENLFYGLYKRTVSFFGSSPDLGASGVPSEAELVLLEPHRSALPAEVFAEAYVPPVSDGSGRIRNQLRQAKELLAEAGWNVQNDRLTNEKGEIFEIEFLETGSSSERVIAPYIQNLKLLGIDARLRLVDPAQYERRTDDFDYDMTGISISQSLTPGLELRNYYGSAYADVAGGWNFSGISDPVLDDLVESVVSANSREELETATRALDRVLRAGHYWIPAWHSGAYYTAYWDEFERPAIQPKYQRGVLDTWWHKGAE